MKLDPKPEGPFEANKMPYNAYFIQTHKFQSIFCSIRIQKEVNLLLFSYTHSATQEGNIRINTVGRKLFIIIYTLRDTKRNVEESVSDMPTTAESFSFGIHIEHRSA